MLRVAQINMATVCRDNFDTWSGFAALGVLQGGVYGHATMDFAHRLGVGSGGPHGDALIIGMSLFFFSSEKI